MVSFLVQFAARFSSRATTRTVHYIPESEYSDYKAFSLFMLLYQSRSKYCYSSEGKTNQQKNKTNKKTVSVLYLSRDIISYMFSSAGFLIIQVRPRGQEMILMEKTVRYSQLPRSRYMPLQAGSYGKHQGWSGGENMNKSSLWFSWKECAKQGRHV